MAESRVAIYASIGANLAIAATKFVAAAFTGSSGMLAEGIHSMVDASDGTLLLFGQHRAKKPADDEHPFGYGHSLYFWALIVAIIFFAVGGGMSVYEGITRSLHPEPIRDVVWSYAGLGAATLFDGTSFVIGVRKFRKQTRGMGVGVLTAMQRSKDPSIFSVVLEDSADLIGIAAAFAGVFLNSHYGVYVADGIASIVIGLVLMGVAVFLAMQSRGLLIGERASEKTIAAIRAAAREVPGVASVAPPLTMQLAPSQVLAMVRVRTDDGDQSSLSRILRRVDERVRSACGEVRWLSVGVADAHGDDGERSNAK